MLHWLIPWQRGEFCREDILGGERKQGGVGGGVGGAGKDGQSESHQN